MTEAPVQPDAPAARSPRGTVVVRPWLVPLLTGVIGLLLGSLITLVVISILAHATPGKATASVAAIDAADKKYTRALSDCSIDTSGALTIDAKRGIMRLHGGSADQSVSGLSPDILSCVVNSLGAPSSVVDALGGQGDVVAGDHTARFAGLTLTWVASAAGDVQAVVAPATQ